MNNYPVLPAEESDTEEILALYRSMIGGKADWNEDYPSLKKIEFDLSRNALFIMKNENNEIIAAISIDEDDEVENLQCWNKELQPAGELSRLCVRKDMQNRGIARVMMNHTFNILKNQGKKSVHIIVRPEHKTALKSYSHLDYKTVGECEMFGKSFVCLERKL